MLRKSAIAYLQELVDAYEELALRYELQKIKTIGDAFMATGGLLKPVPNPVLSAVQCGLEMVTIVRRMPARWDVRVESHGVPGAVTVSASAWQAVAERCRGESLGMVHVKGKGGMEIVRVDGLRGA